MAADLMEPAVDTPVTDAPGRASLRRRVIVLVAIVAVVTIAAGVTAALQGAPDNLADEGIAPTFDLAQVGADGRRVSLADFAGRPVVLNFWASWCVPCRDEMPALQTASERLRDGVAFVGINYQDTASAGANFQRELGVSYPSGLDADGAVASRYGVRGLPTTVLIDRRGRIVARVVGGVTLAKLLALVDKAFGPDAVPAK